MVSSKAKFLVALSYFLSNFELSRAGAVYVKLFGLGTSNAVILNIDNPNPILNAPDGLTNFENLVGTFVFYDTAAGDKKGSPVFQGNVDYRTSPTPISGTINLPQLGAVLPISPSGVYWTNSITFFSSTNFRGTTRTFYEFRNDFDIPPAGSVIVTGSAAWSVCFNIYLCSCLKPGVSGQVGGAGSYESKFYTDTSNRREVDIFHNIAGSDTTRTWKEKVRIIVLHTGYDCTYDGLGTPIPSPNQRGPLSYTV